MSERTPENCNRYLDRIAHLIEGASGQERSAFLKLADRLMLELQEASEQEELILRLAERRKRLSSFPTSASRKQCND